MLLPVSVCFCVCLSDYSKSFEWIFFVKFFGGVDRGPRTDELDLVAIRITIRIQEFLKDSLGYLLL